MKNNIFKDRDGKIEDLIKDVLTSEDCKKCFLYSEEKGNYPIFCAGNRINPEIMLIFQNPGTKKLSEEKKYHRSEINTEKLLELSKDGLDKYWIKGKQKGFFDFLEKHNIICSTSQAGKGPNTYFTDCIKCSELTDHSLRNAKKRNVIEEKCLDFLRREIYIIKPKLIITSGYMPLEMLNKIYNNSIEKISGKIDFCTQPTKIHGYLFKIRDNNIFLIPIIHISREYMTLRKTFECLLEEGLREYKTRNPDSSIKL